MLIPQSTHKLLLSGRKLRPSRAVWFSGVALVGGVLLVIRIFAAGTPTAFEAESGVLSGPASVASVTGASGTGAVRFSVAATPTPTPTPGARSCPALPAHPDASCTGVTPGITLTTVDNMTVSQDGTVLENLNVTGRLTITGNNVIIRNIKLVNNDYYGVLVYGANLTISDSTLVGGANTQAPLAANGGSFHALRLDVSGAGDGVTMGNDSSLTDSYIHDLDSDPSDHNDGVNADGSQGTSIIHNTVLNNHDQTSALTIGNSTVASNVVVKGNLLAGGGYTIYAGLGAGAGHGIDFENNVFSRQYFTNSGYWGPVAYWQTGNGNIWLNNTYSDGVAITP